MSRQSQHDQTDLARKVGAKSARRLKSLGNRSNKTWFGLGMMGVIGWSVAVPTLAGIFIGIWIDSTRQVRFSWTLILLMTGILLGCLNAWYWLRKEDRAMHEDQLTLDEDSSTHEENNSNSGKNTAMHQEDQPDRKEGEPHD